MPGSAAPTAVGQCLCLPAVRRASAPWEDPAAAAERRLLVALYEAGLRVLP